MLVIIYIIKYLSVCLSVCLSSSYHPSISYIYIYIYTYTHTHTYIDTYICMCVCIYIYIYIYTCICLFLSLHTCKYLSFINMYDDLNLQIVFSRMYASVQDVQMLKWTCPLQCVCCFCSLCSDCFSLHLDELIMWGSWQTLRILFLSHESLGLVSEHIPASLW